MSHALPLYSADAVRAIEREAGRFGLDATLLMARAGQSVADVLRARWPEARRVGVLCGRGNNGGDGYVAALALQRAGLEVHVVAAGEPATPEARKASEAWHSAGHGVLGLGPALPRVDVWVDALFGLGLRRAPEGVLRDVLQAIAAQAVPVLAVDVPSGIDADRGHAPGYALAADLTVCLVAAKRGLFTAAGRDAAGEVCVDALGIPSEGIASRRPDAFGVAAPALRGRLPRRVGDSHKGRYGRVVCVGGDDGFEGALVLCAEAAVRAGAGSVRAWTRPAGKAALLARCPEVMVRALGDEVVDTIPALHEAAEVLAIGPGLGRGPWAAALGAAALRAPGPKVIDADALVPLAEGRAPAGDAVLTPHPGEAARLLGLTTAEVQADRFAALQALVARYESAVVLKGSGTLVGAPGEVPRVVQAGNPGMASAGMGDVLTGLVAALRAQGLSAFDAAWVGALAHAVAGDVAAAGRTRGLRASDLVRVLPGVLA